MDLERIRSFEIGNQSEVFFWQEGEQRLAFDRSAWFFVSMFPDIVCAVQQTLFRGQRTVFISIGKDLLEELVSDVQGVLRFDDRITFPSRTQFDVIAYYKWKDPSRPGAPRAGAESMKDRLWNEVKNYNMDSPGAEDRDGFIRRIKAMVEVK